MSPTDDTPPPHTSADYYGFFLMGVSELIEDARSARMEPAAIELLLQAQALFRAEFHRRHPSVATEAIDASASTAGDTMAGPVPRYAVGALIDDAYASEADDEGIALLYRADQLFWPPTGS